MLGDTPTEPTQDQQAALIYAEGELVGTVVGPGIWRGGPSLERVAEIKKQYRYSASDEWVYDCSFEPPRRLVFCGKY